MIDIEDRIRLIEKYLEDTFININIRWNLGFFDKILTVEFHKYNYKISIKLPYDLLVNTSIEYIKIYIKNTLLNEWRFAILKKLGE